MADMHRTTRSATRASVQQNLTADVNNATNVPGRKASKRGAIHRVNATAAMKDEESAVVEGDSYDKESEDSEEFEESDEDGAWGAKLRRNSNGKALAKRPKTGASAKGVGGKKKHSRLSLFPTIPLDILFEILLQLTPREILRVSRVNKSFYNLLSQGTGTFVWPRIRADCDAPAPMDNMSEYQWANLLFGEPRCQLCDRVSINTVDFALRRRLCQACMRLNLVSFSRFAKTFEDFDMVLVEMVPYSSSYHLPFSARNRRYFWKNEVFEVAAVLGRYDSDISLRKPNAKQRRAGYIQSQKDRITKLREHVVACEEWSRTEMNRKSEAKDNIRAQRREAIKEKLLSLGYLKADVESVRIPADSDRALTDRGWAMIKDEMVSTIKARRRARIQIQHGQLVLARQNILSVSLRPFMSTMAVHDWIFFLPRNIIESLEICDNLLYAEADVDITQQMFGPLIAHLQDVHTQRRLAVTNQLSTSLAADGGLKAIFEASTGKKLSSDAVLPSVTETLSLATTVFKCGNWSCNIPLISVEGPFRHEHHHTEFTFNHDLAASIRAGTLITLAGLDVLTARPKDMDALNLWFVCEDCRKTSTGWSADRRPVGDWRGCVNHTYDTRLPHTFRLLTAEERPHQPVDPQLSRAEWTCTHCNVHLDQWVTADAAKLHLSEEHGIQNGSHREDFMLKPGVQYTMLKTILTKAPIEKPETGEL